MLHAECALYVFLRCAFDPLQTRAHARRAGASRRETAPLPPRVVRKRFVLRFEDEADAVQRELDAWAFAHAWPCACGVASGAG
jgi:hypothetical protein